MTKMKRGPEKSVRSVIFCAVVFSLTACGKSQSAPPPLPLSTTSTIQTPIGTGPVCGPGTFNPTGTGCTTAPNFNTACIYQGGTVTTSADGVQVCQTHIDTPTYTYSSSYNAPTGLVPRINPNNPIGTDVIPANVPVNAGDLVQVLATGGWGGSNGGWIPIYTQSTCSQNPVTGNSTNDGEPNGLMASDGANAYFVGNQQFVRISSTGTLSLGFNAPTGQGQCFYLSFSIRVERCIDATGAAHPCQGS